MLAKIYSAAVYGVDAYEVEIEVNGAGGDPNIVIVGLPDAAVKESRDRVTTAIANSGYLLAARPHHDQSRPGRHQKEGTKLRLANRPWNDRGDRRTGQLAVRKFQLRRRARFGWRGPRGERRACQLRWKRGVAASAHCLCRKPTRSKPQWSIRSTSTACKICGRRLISCAAKPRSCPRAPI